MFGFLKRLFGTKSLLPADPEEIVEEFWMTDFSRIKAARFTEESGDSYASVFTGHGLALRLTRKNLFAWTINRQFRYRNFVLEALLEIPAKRDPANEPSNTAGNSSAGILFRHISDTTFYSVQISDRGYIRLDAVMNNTPLPVLGWTEIDRNTYTVAEDISAEKAPYLENESVYGLRLIVRDTTITLIVNDSWIAECTDETIQSAGNIAFSGQTWDSCSNAEPVLRAISIESRQIDVETLYTRWNQYIPIPDQAHRKLAETWYAMGRYLPALFELRKIWKRREPQYDELLLAGQVYLAQRLYPEAADFFHKALEMNPESTEANAELAGLFYLQNLWEDLEKHLEALSAETRNNSAFLSNLEGHLLSWKGDHAQAAQAYTRAGQLNNQQGLFFLNAGTEWHLAEKRDEAAHALREAARLFLKNDEYEDLSHCIDLLRSINPDDQELPTLSGKYCYATGDIDGAREQLAMAVKKRTKDSAVWYLQGMIQQHDGDMQKARKSFEKAISLEPEYGLYRFRLAELKFNMDEACEEELHDALEKDPDNGWVYNLASLSALKNNRLDDALQYITRARSLLPREMPILINYAEIERRRGNLDSILPLLSGEDPEALHAAANLLVEDGRYDEADTWYRQALHRSPYDPELLTDCAANCLERDLISEADDLLSRAFESTTNDRMYQLIAVLAGKKGEYARAEIALIQGLEEFPDNPLLLHELSGVYIMTGKLDKAHTIADRLEKAGHRQKAEALRKEIHEAGTNKIVCSSCGREWRVPRDIPPQGSLTVHAMPPDDLPAGTCPDCRDTVCIGCAKEHLGEDGRFRCKQCGVPLKLIDQNVLWLLGQWHQQALKEMSKGK